MDWFKASIEEGRKLVKEIIWLFPPAALTLDAPSNENGESREIIAQLLGEEVKEREEGLVIPTSDQQGHIRVKIILSNYM